MTSFAPPTCADCRQEVIRVTSAKTGRKIRLDPVPTIDTRVHYRGGAAKDGPRYRALGNSMAVPVVARIGRRIELVEAME